MSKIDLVNAWLGTEAPGNCLPGPYLPFGVAAAVAFALRDQPHRSLRHFGWNRDIVPHGPVGELRTRAGLTPEAIADSTVILQAWQALGATG
jgi:hypothetical protein